MDSGLPCLGVVGGTKTERILISVLYCSHDWPAPSRWLCLLMNRLVKKNMMCIKDIIDYRLLTKYTSRLFSYPDLPSAHTHGWEPTEAPRKPGYTKSAKPTAQNAQLATTTHRTEDTSYSSAALTRHRNSLIGGRQGDDWQHLPQSWSGTSLRRDRTNTGTECKISFKSFSTYSIETQ